MNLAERAVRSVAELGGINILQFGTAFAMQIVFARLLTPSIFGTVSLAVAILGLFNLPSRWGIPEAIMQDTDYKHTFSTIFWLRLGYAFGITIIILLAGSILNLFYRSEVIAVLYALTLSNIVLLVTDPFKGPIQRDFILRRAGIVRFGSLLVASAVAWWLSIRGFGVWALTSFYVIQDVLTGLSFAVISSQYPNLRFNREAARWFINFARGMVISKVLNIAEDKADEFIIGTLTTATTLGFYRIAWQLAWSFHMVTNHALGMGMIPTFAELKEDANKSRKGLEFLIRMILRIVIPGYLIAIFVAPEFITFVFGDEWSGAVAIFQVMALAGILIPIVSTGKQFYYARGESGTVLNVQKYYLSVMVVAMIICIPTFGGIGAAVAISITQLVGCTIIIRQFQDDINYRLREGGAIEAISGIVAAVVGYGITQIGQPETPILVIIVMSLAVGSVFYVLLYLINRDLIRSDIVFLIRSLSNWEPAE